MSVGPIRDMLQFQWCSMQVSIRNDKICVVSILKYQITLVCWAEVRGIPLDPSQSLG